MRSQKENLGGKHGSQKYAAKPVDIIKLMPLQFEHVQEEKDEDKASESSVSVSSSSRSETEKYPRIVQPVEDVDSDQRALNE